MTRYMQALLDAANGLFEGLGEAETWNIRTFATADGLFVKAKDIFNQTTHRLFLNFVGGRYMRQPSRLFIRRFDSTDVWELSMEGMLPKPFDEWLDGDGPLSSDEYKEGIEALRSHIRDFLEFLS